MARFMNRKTALAAVVVSVAGLGAVALHFRAHKSVEAVAIAFSCEEGTEDVYSILYSSRGSASESPMAVIGGQPGGSQVHADASVQARMHVACASASAKEYRTALAFENVSGNLDVNHGGVGSAPAAQLLVGTTMVSRNERGQVLGIRYDPRMPEGGRAMVRDILAFSQVTVANTDTPAVSWTTREEDVNGRYEASYRVVSNDKNVLSLLKDRRTVDSNIKTAWQKPRAEAMKGSSAEYRINVGDKRLEAASVYLNFELKHKDTKLGSSSASLSLTYQLSERLSDEEKIALQATQTHTDSVSSVSDLAASDRTGAIEEKIQRITLGDDTWTTLSKRLDQDSKDNTKDYLKLKALFYLHPETCAAGSRALTSIKDPNSKAFLRLTGALSAVGSSASQQALLDAARAKQADARISTVLVSSLGLTKTPTSETFEGLKQLSKTAPEQEVRDTARLALGNLARTAAESDPSKASNFVAGELNGWKSATSSQDKIMTLLVLGNVGSPAILPAAKEALSDPDPAVRVAAASALRFVDSPEAELLLVDRVANDPDSRVRAQAIGSLALRFGTTQTRDVVVKASQTDPDEPVRMAGVQWMAGELPQAPDLAEALEVIAANDRAVGVRNAARLALLRSRNAG